MKSSECYVDAILRCCCLTELGVGPVLSLCD